MSGGGAGAGGKPGMGVGQILQTIGKGAHRALPGLQMMAGGPGAMTTQPAEAPADAKFLELAKMADPAVAAAVAQPTPITPMSKRPMRSTGLRPPRTVWSGGPY